MTRPPWPAVGACNPRDLVEARLEAHHAAQIIVSLGISFLPPSPDDSHTNLEWIDELGALAGGRMPAPSPFRGALRIGDLTLLRLDDRGKIAAAFPLSRRTVEAGYQWLRGQVEQAGLDPGRLTPAKHYAIPAHPVATGASFNSGTAGFVELSRYYAGASLLLSSLQRAFTEATAVRCWPHHFDLATLLILGGDRTIGIGLSPGDDSYPEPYYYVSPYPYPPGDLPALPAGAWHREGWVGAVLTGTDISGERDGAAQRRRVSGFLDAALESCRVLLGHETTTRSS